MQKPLRSENVLYRGALLRVRKLPKGWRVFITLPDADLRQDVVPTTADDNALEEVIEEAKELVHRQIRASAITS
jgi:hypothetical protein